MSRIVFRGFMWTLVVLCLLTITLTGIYRNQLKSFRPLFKNLMINYGYGELSNTTNLAQENCTTTPTNPTPLRQKVLILFWSTYFGSPVVCDKPIRRSKVCNNTNLRHCKVPCEITADRRRVGNASVMIVHARDPKPLPSQNYSHIPLVLFTWENPVYSPMLYNKPFLAHFTYLLSYRADVADFFLPSMDKPSVEPRPIPFASKKGLIAAAFSHCETARTAYLKELMKHIQVDSYGACLRNKKGLQDRYIGNFKVAKTKILQNYKFTIVFHNQDCDYFVDDQLTHALNAGSVPVYMGTDKVHELLGGNLNNSIIKVKNFATPKKLAEYLLMVSKNESLYNGYLKWKYEGFQFPQSFLDKPQGRAWLRGEIQPDYCELCETMAAITDKQLKMKQKGLIKADYCKPRSISDWLPKS